MAESLEEYIAKLKAENERQGKSSLEWYLQQIKELAAKGQTEKEAKAQETTSGEALAKAKKAATTTREAARKEVIKDSVQETTSQVNRAMIGKMLFFNYFPKGAMKLPYYDSFPLVFPFTVQGNSMTGMNMHYLPPVERARLMMSLTQTLSTMTLDDHTRLNISYKLLAGASKYVYFKPCIKKYLFSYIRSRLMIISPHKWNSVLFMPIAKFMKASEFNVWQDSIAMIRKTSFHQR